MSNFQHIATKFCARLAGAAILAAAACLLQAPQAQAQTAPCHIIKLGKVLPTGGGTLQSCALSIKSAMPKGSAVGIGYWAGKQVQVTADGAVYLEGRGADGTGSALSNRCAAGDAVGCMLWQRNSVHAIGRWNVVHVPRKTPEISELKR